MSSLLIDKFFQITKNWWGCLDLNQGPIGYEPTALTTELHPRDARLRSRNRDEYIKPGAKVI